MPGALRGHRFIVRFAYLGVGVADRAQFVTAAIENAALESNVVISARQISPVRRVVGQRYDFDDLSDRASGSWACRAALHDITQRPDLDDARRSQR